MSIFGNMYVSKTGMYSMARGMEITANNLTNLNTVGFKGDRPAFVDLYSALGGGTPFLNGGFGVTVGDIETTFLEGSINDTGVPTDLAIHGKGFFMVYDEDSKKTYYTRDGMFHLEDFDENYLKLVDPNGYALKGQQLNNIATNVSGEGIILIPKQAPGKVTNYLSLRFNLDATVPVETQDQPLKDAWDATQNPPISPSAYDWLFKVYVFDAQGQRHELTIYFDRTTNDNEYEFIITADPSLYENPSKDTGILGSGTITFDNSGLVKDITYTSANGDDLVKGSEAMQDNPDLKVDDNAALLPVPLTFTSDNPDEQQKIFLDLGLKYNENDQIVASPDAVTSYASPFVSLYQYQDGYSSGLFKSLMVHADGTIEAEYSNDQSLEVAQVLLASFPAEARLEKVGLTLFKAPPNITPAIFEPGEDAPATIVSGALENSNVDIVQEMVNLISLQRVFESNSRVLSVSDQLLEDILRWR